MYLLLFLQGLVVFGFIAGLFIEELTLKFFAMFALSVVIFLLILYRICNPPKEKSRRSGKKPITSSFKKQGKRKKELDLDWIDDLEMLDAIFDDG